MKILALWFLTFLSACQSTPNIFGPQTSPSVFVDNTEENNKVLASTSASASESCNGSCGYITTKAFAEFPDLQKSCKEKKLSKKECNIKFYEMMNSRLLLQYPNANYQQVVLECKADPINCDTSTLEGANKLEEKIIHSEAEYNRNKAAEAHANILAKAEAEQQARMKAFRDYLQRQQDRKTNCTTYTDAYRVTHTSCN